MKKKSLKILSLLLVLILAATTCGCFDSDKSGGTIDEPDITVSYLNNEYTKQLIKDGATHKFGSVISIEELDGGGAKVQFACKAYVEDSNYAKGFYIADLNQTEILYLQNETRATYIHEGSTLEQVCTIEDFIKDCGSESSDVMNDKLYDIYLVDDQILLILGRYL